MYSPKISEELVPVLYRLAKARKMPMTRLVDDLIRQALSWDIPPQGEPAAGYPAGSLIVAEPRPAVAA